jgi:ABC-type sugar transport system ATPase subunit
VTALEPKERDVAMVFQGLALYPHMTVSENMAFGLRARRTPADETDRRVREAAETLGLTRYLEKRPRELSGGERQRVALGRALVRRPRLFLFDEPLSSLDAQLRQELREELARLHRLTRTTSIYVTHDQKEALSLGDKVAVMERGTLRQLAAPEDVYRNPHDLFVARFVGEPPINLIEGEVEAGGSAGGGAALHVPGASEKSATIFRAPGLRMRLPGSSPPAGRATLGLRPEAIGIGEAGASDTARATVERVEHLGGETLIHLRGEWGPLVVRAGHQDAAPVPGSTVGVRPDAARALLFDRSGARI